MKIDECIHTFEDLALKVLPAHLARLVAALESPWSATFFAKQDFGPRTIARSVGLPSDFSGCYALAESSRVIYVGISRSVLARVRQHMMGRTHFDASLAYAMAQREQPTQGRRSDVMKDADFRKAFLAAQMYLQTLCVAAVQIDNPVELYLFEVFAAMYFETSEWNTFRTH